MGSALTLTNQPPRRYSPSPTVMELSVLDRIWTRDLGGLSTGRGGGADGSRRTWLCASHLLVQVGRWMGGDLEQL